MRTVGITMDLEGATEHDVVPVPLPGHFLVSILKDGTYGATYEIVSAREVRRRDPKACPRFALRCRRWPLEGRQATWHFTWYCRRRKSRLTDPP